MCIQMGLVDSTLLSDTKFPRQGRGDIYCLAGETLYHLGAVLWTANRVECTFLMVALVVIW